MSPPRLLDYTIRIHERGHMTSWYLEFNLPGADAQRVSRILFAASKNSIDAVLGTKAVRIQSAEQITHDDGNTIIYSFSYTTPDMGLNERKTFSITQPHVTVAVKAEPVEDELLQYSDIDEV